MTVTKSAAAAAAITLIATLAAVLGVTPPQASAHSADGERAARSGAMVGAPAVRDCYRMDITGLRKKSISGRKVPCRTKHTMVIFKVAKVPTSIPMNANDPALASFAFTTCAAATKKKVAPSLLAWGRSAYTWYRAVPTDAQRERGARWISCGLVLLEGSRLAPLRGTGIPRAVKNPPAWNAQCVTANFKNTTCAARHAYGPRMYDTTVNGLLSRDEGLARAHKVCARHAKRYRAATYRLGANRTYLGCLR